MGILEADTIKQAEIKEKWPKSTAEEQKQKQKKLLETELCRRNLIKGINTRVEVPLVS